MVKNRIASLFGAAALTLGLLPLMALASAAPASAATNGLNAFPESSINAAGSMHTFYAVLGTDDGTITPTGSAPVVFEITAGPNADLVNAAVDGTCSIDTTPNPDSNNRFVCSYTDGASTSGDATDTIVVFQDLDNDGTLDAGEPSDTITKSWAQAPDTLTVTPPSDSAPAYTCNPFTVLVEDADGTGVPNTTVDVQVTPTATSTSSIAFCNPAAGNGAGGPNPQAAPGAYAFGAAPATSPAVGGEFTTDQNGQFTFGIVSDAAGTPNTWDIVAFVDATSDNIYVGGTDVPADTATKTFTATSPDDITGLVASPDSATNVAGNDHVFTAQLTPALPGITVSAEVTNGPNAGATVTCTASDQAGTSYCSYAGTKNLTAGSTDTIVVFVDQSGGTTGVLDPADEPNDTITKNWVSQDSVKANTYDADIFVSCGDNGSQSCVNPITDGAETFTAVVTNALAGDAPISGVTVQWSTDTGNTNGTGPGATLSNYTCVTDANGSCSTTLTNPTPTLGDNVTVTGSAYKLKAQNNQTCCNPVNDSATKSWAGTVDELGQPLPAEIQVDPQSATNQVNTEHTVVATVLDANGAPIENQDVDFDFGPGGGPNAHRNQVTTCVDLLTDVNGQVSCTYTDTGDPNAAGTDVITVYADTNNNNALDNNEVSAVSTKDWVLGGTSAPTGARTIDLTPNDPTVGTGTVEALTATVKDRFGNPVPGVSVTFTQTGVGGPTSGSLPTTITTDVNGQATINFTSNTAGTEAVTATITTPSTQCTNLANDPAGSTAGDCDDTSTITWAAGAPAGNVSGAIPGYTLVATDGGIFNFGTAFFGSTGSLRLAAPVVGLAYTPTGKGYWLVATDGGIFSFGDAKFFGSTGAIKLAAPVVGMASTPSGNGYWLVATDGGVFSFGDAKFFGSTGAIKLNKPVVNIMRTTDGLGYWLVASDGGIFAFGNAKFFGSTGAIKLNLPVVGGARTPSGQGYYLVASDGGVFAFGDAKFFGSTGSLKLNSPVVGIGPTPTNLGYWLFAKDGGVFAFGDAPFRGSLGSLKLNAPIVAGAVAPTAS